MEENIYNAIFKVNHSKGSGTCFYLKEYNIFVTNYHVVAGFREVALADNDKNVYLGKVVLVNPAQDLALINVDHDFSMLPSFFIADADSVPIGSKVLVAGYPYGMPFTVTEGSVSSPKQMLEGKYYLQTDAAVNPGNSGGPILNEKKEVVGITVSKITSADNMGFGIRTEALKLILEHFGELDRNTFQVQCGSCEELTSEEEEFCPSCGEKLPPDVFKEQELTPLAEFCETAIAGMGINPILARVGDNDWCFHKGSSEIRIFEYDDDYLFAISPIVLLPKKDVEPVLEYILTEDLSPYKLGTSGRTVYLMYRIHLSDISEESEEEITRNIVNMAFKADELDNYLIENFGCEFTEFSKAELN